jgi:hypothetical protein
MIPSRAVHRSLSITQRAGKGLMVQQRCFRAASRSHITVASRPPSSARNAAFLLSATLGVGCLYHLGYPRKLYAEEIPTPAEVRFEAPRRKESSREENRDLISSQHLQVKKSWENPGVYCWGSNSGEELVDNEFRTSYIFYRPSGCSRFRRAIYQDSEEDGFL